MPVKDKVVTWWIQNIVLPKREIIDQPGFVVTTFTEGTKRVYLRDLFLPEKLFELIENIVVETYGFQGRQALYSAGKKFGYIFASLSNFPTIKDTSLDEISKFAYLLVRYIEGTYAQEAQHEVDWGKKFFSISFDNYIICRDNGIGHIMTEGGIIGIWSFGMQDTHVEGAQLQCQGRGDSKCVVLCGPEDELEKTITVNFTEYDMPNLKLDATYRNMNEIRPTKYSKNSLKNLLTAGFFSYKKGILSYKEQRFFHCDSHILFILEQELTSLEDGENILFNACYEFGKLLRQSYGKNDFVKFIPDFFSALGFGDIFVVDSHPVKISFFYFPWTTYCKDLKFLIIRGIMSGIVSDSLGKEIIFHSYDIKQEKFLTLTISQ